MSPNIQDEPDTVNGPILIKQDLRGYFTAPIRDAAFKYGIVSFFKLEGLFTPFEIVRFTRAGHVIAGLVAKAREEERRP